MKKLLYLFILIILLISSTSMHKSVLNLPEKISVALLKGDSKSLANYFNSDIELVILGNEDVYSKAQAEVIIKDFFRKYPPTNFEVLHEGGKTNSRYAIGNLTTEPEVFRVYILLRFTDNKPFIYQFKIEHNNE